MWNTKTYETDLADMEVTLYRYSVQILDGTPVIVTEVFRELPLSLRYPYSKFILFLSHVNLRFINFNAEQKIKRNEGRLTVSFFFLAEVSVISVIICVAQCQLKVIGLALISCVTKAIWKQFLSVPRSARNLIETFFFLFISSNVGCTDEKRWVGNLSICHFLSFMALFSYLSLFK
jgi:hypothetical protein